MIRTTLLILCVALSGAVSAQGQSNSAANNPVQRVIPLGNDGDETYYNVKCRDKTVASIVVYNEKQQVCVTPQGKKTECRGQWPLQFAAQAGCGG